MTRGVVPGVPLLQVGAGGFRLTVPPAVGDEVLLLFSRRSLDKLKAFGGSDVDPADTRIYHLADAVAVPCRMTFVSPWTGVRTDALTLGKDGGPQVHVTASDILLNGTDAVDPIADGTKVDAQLGALKTALASWVPVPGDGGLALKTILTTLFLTWPSATGASVGKVKP
jgi:hypothetical protein